MYRTNLEDLIVGGFGCLLLDACFPLGLLALVREQVELDVGVRSPVLFDGREPFGAVNSHIQLLFGLLVPHPNLQLSSDGVVVLPARLTVHTAQTVEALGTLGTTHDGDVGVRGNRFLTFKTVFLWCFLHREVNTSVFLVWAWRSLCRTQNLETKGLSYLAIMHTTSVQQQAYAVCSGM